MKDFIFNDTYETDVELMSFDEMVVNALQQLHKPGYKVFGIVHSSLYNHYKTSPNWKGFFMDCKEENNSKQHMDFMVQDKNGEKRFYKVVSAGQDYGNFIAKCYWSSAADNDYVLIISKDCCNNWFAVKKVRYAKFNTVIHPKCFDVKKNEHVLKYVRKYQRYSTEAYSFYLKNAKNVGLNPERPSRKNRPSRTWKRAVREWYKRHKTDDGPYPKKWNEKMVEYLGYIRSK